MEEIFPSSSGTGPAPKTWNVQPLAAARGWKMASIILGVILTALRVMRLRQNGKEG